MKSLLSSSTRHEPAEERMMPTGNLRATALIVEGELLCCAGGWRGDGSVLGVRRLLFAAAPPLQTPGVCRQVVAACGGAQAPHHTALRAFGILDHRGVCTRLKAIQQSSHRNLVLMQLLHGRPVKNH